MYVVKRHLQHRRLWNLYLQIYGIYAGNFRTVHVKVRLTRHYYNTYNDFTYNELTYTDFTYNDFTYNEITYNDFTYNDFTYNDYL